MLRFRLPELLLERERREGHKITWRQVAEATGLSPQAVANLASRTQRVVTNTAYVEALCRYFRCSPGELMELVPPLEADAPCQVDELYPERKKKKIVED